MTCKHILKDQVLQYLKSYINGYGKQPAYEEYSKEILIDDILYSLGVAIDKEKYSFAPGYRNFKKDLKEHLSHREKLTDVDWLIRKIKKEIEGMPGCFCPDMEYYDGEKSAYNNVLDWIEEFNEVYKNKS